MNHLAKTTLERFHAGEWPLSASKLNRIVDAVNALARLIGRATDAGEWMRCLSTDDFDPYSVVEVYHATFDAEGIVLLVRPVGSTTSLATGTGTGTGSEDENDIFYAANENYPLDAGEKGWVKIIPCAPNFCTVRATGATIAYGDDLEASGSEVMQGDRVFWAASNERVEDRRLVNISLQCKQIGESLEGNDCPCCCKPCICRPDEEDIVSDCSGLELSDAFAVDGVPAPYAPISNLIHTSGCLYRSDSNAITICEGTNNEQSIGNYRWELVPSFDRDSATLTFTKVSGTGSGSGSSASLTVVYRNDRYFDERCKTLFSLATKRHEIEAVIGNEAIAFPCTLCVRPIGEECDTCEVPRVPINCCPGEDNDSISGVLNASIAETGGPPHCITDGTGVSLTLVSTVQGPTTWEWEGTFNGGTACANNNYTLTFIITPGPMSCSASFRITGPGGVCVSGPMTGLGVGGALDCPFTCAVSAGFDMYDAANCPDCCVGMGVGILTLTVCQPT